MKKLLALVLALVMPMSLAVTSNAAFKDADKVEHKEAVDMMTALGVINGMPDGSFNPDGNVTRAEMAKMISIIALGNVDAAAFIGTSTDLTDISGHWAEGFIKYCYSQGVIAGKGNGIFDPNANVTAVEAAKMLCVAIGYNAGVQKYVGSDWQINVTRDALLSGFYKNLSGLVATKALSCDEAAQMIWNALDATLIRKTASVNRLDGSIIDNYAPDSHGTDLLEETFKAQVVTGVLTGMTGNEKGFTVEDLDNGTTTYVNGTARGYHGTVNNADYTADLTELLGQEVNVILKTNTSKNAVLGVYSTGVSKVYETTWNAVKQNSKKPAEVKFGGVSYKLEAPHANTAATADELLVIETNGIASTYDAADFTNTRYCTPVKFIDIDGNGKLDIAIVPDTQIAKVTYLGKDNISVKDLGGDNVISTTEKRENCDLYDGIAKDDYVAVTVSPYTGNYAFTKLESASGTVTGVKTVSGVENYLIDGTWYKPDEAHNNLAISAGDTVNYLAVAGLIYDFEVTSGAVGANSLAMVVNAGQVNASGVTGASAQAKLLFADGTTKAVTVVKMNSTDDSTISTLKDAVVAEIGELVIYKVNKDGDYELKTIAAGLDKDDLDAIIHGFDGSGSAASYNNKKIGGYELADDAVVFVLTKGSKSTAAADNKGKIYTGKEFKTNYGTGTALTATDNASCLYVTSNGFSKATIAAIVGNPAILQGSNYGYLTADTYKSTVNGEDYANYTIWTGEKEIKTTEKNGTLYATGTVVTFDADGENVKNVAIPDGLTTGAVMGYTEGKKDITFDGVNVNKLTEDTSYIFIDSDKKVASEGAIAIADEPTSGNYIDNVRYIVAANGDVVLLVVDVNNEMKAAGSYTLSSSTNAAKVNAALKTYKTVTVTDATLTLDAAITVIGGRTLVIDSTTLDLNGKALKVEDGATLVINKQQTAAVLEGITAEEGATLVVKAESSTTVSANKWYTSAGVKDTSNAVALTTSNKVAANSTYVFGTIYTQTTNAGDTAGTAWVKK